MKLTGPTRRDLTDPHSLPVEGSPLSHPKVGDPPLTHSPSGLLSPLSSLFCKYFTLPIHPEVSIKGVKEGSSIHLRVPVLHLIRGRLVNHCRRLRDTTLPNPESSHSPTLVNHHSGTFLPCHSGHDTRTVGSSRVTSRRKDCRQILLIERSLVVYVEE